MSPSLSAASSRVGFDPWRTRSGACASTSEQPWIAAPLTRAFLHTPRHARRDPRATRALEPDTVEAGGGTGWPRRRRDSRGHLVDFPDGRRLDFCLEHREGTLDNAA